MATTLNPDAMKRQFKEFDRNGTGTLDLKELTELLRQGDPGMTDQEIRALFRGVDKNKDSVIQFGEFVDYIYSQGEAADARTHAGRRSRAAQEARPRDAGDHSLWNQLEPLYTVRVGKDGCDSAEFAKLCRECELYDGSFKQVQADLVFKKILPRGKRRMTFEHFKEAVQEIAARKNCETSFVQQAILEAGAPKWNATKAESVALHDDRSTYTGQHVANEHHNATGEAGSTARFVSDRHDQLKIEGASEDSGDPSLWEKLQPIFAEHVGKECNGTEFAKLCRDCNLYDTTFKAIQADLVFKHVLPRGKRRMDFALFQEAVKEIASRKQCATQSVQQVIIEAGGPKFSGTKADDVRLHDDRSTYTGAHAANEVHAEAAASQSGAERRRTTAAARRPSVDEKDVGDEGLWEKLQDVFKEHVGEDCDSGEFSRLCKDCELFDPKFKAVQADLVFKRVAPRGKRMDFGKFKDAVMEIARRKACETRIVQEAILNSDGPKFNATKADEVRFHDDRSTYTGSHADSDRKSHSRAGRREKEEKPDDPGDESLWPKIEEVFQAFAGKNGACEITEFSKLCNDCNLYDASYRSTDADLVFKRVLPRGKRKMDFSLFKTACVEVAQRKECETKIVQTAILAADGPRFNATEADEVRFHDDRETYTGTHANK